jgi:hypothetical protein
MDIDASSSPANITARFLEDTIIERPKEIRRNVYTFSTKVFLLLKKLTELNITKDVSMYITPFKSKEKAFMSSSHSLKRYPANEYLIASTPLIKLIKNPRKPIRSKLGKNSSKIIRNIIPTVVIISGYNAFIKISPK